MNVTGEVLHSLGMLGALLGAGAQSAFVVAAGRRRRSVRGRGARLLETAPAVRTDRWSRTVLVRVRAGAGGGAGAGGRAGPAAGAARWAAPAGVWLTGWFLVGGLLGCAVGAAAAYGVWRGQRPRPRPGPGESREERAVIAAQLPLAADLLAACIAVGAGPREAAEAVGESIGGPVGDRLARAAAEIRLGGEPAEAWGRLGEIPGAGPLARCLHRAGATGAPVAEPVSRLAETMRAERAGAAVARAQRAGVLITAPVGLCFLPAFLAVGVAPVIVGLAGGLLAAR
ncbi:type II secretion system F family protein [Streptomyces griseus]|uniref:Type II secretion system F family protein n=1 Tax=Streptomyces stephensoniae TaxID=3375367 RepID=A0ABU2W3F0_9ACTN|nr:type II secretion system F family protein [Streptomyces griseus]MDT0492028.1 type II secretion system F family protein [Streptomyces griseus]